MCLLTTCATTGRVTMMPEQWNIIHEREPEHSFGELLNPEEKRDHREWNLFLVFAFFSVATPIAVSEVPATKLAVAEKHIGQERLLLSRDLALRRTRFVESVVESRDKRDHQPYECREQDHAARIVAH